MSHPSATGSPKHWPALDGLRAVAVVVVMIYHLTWEKGHPGDPNLLQGGYLGVDVFFVLSGFLITWLLISEWDTHGGRVSFRHFYARRALRLFPALGCVIIAALALAVVMGSAGSGQPWFAHPTFDGLPWVVAFAGNWAEALGIGSLGLLGHTWSLAVEEQFYFLWPAILVLIIRRRPERDRVGLWLAVTALTDMIYRTVVFGKGLYSPGRIYFGTDTHCDGLLIGCAVAFWLASGRPANLHPAGAKLIKGAAGLGATILITLLIVPDSAFGMAAAVLAGGALLAGLVMGAAPVPLERALASRLAVWIGRRSYGLYIWHFLVYMTAWSLYGHYIRTSAATGLGGRTGAGAIDGTAIVASFIVAAVSYHFIELPALRLKRRLRNSRTREGQAVVSTPLPG